MTQRRLGVAGARAVASSGSTEAAVALLATSPYRRDVHAGMSAQAACRTVGSVCLWHLRVLAGWLPPRGGEGVRVFAGRFELVNIADRLVALAGGRVWEPYRLGSLGVAWSQVVAASTAQEVRAALAGSAWGDPGTADWPAAAVVLDARWASWLAGAVPTEAAWAAGAAALAAARQVGAGQPVPPAAVANLRSQLGRGWETASDLAGLASRLPRAAAWALQGVEGPEDLWRAEGRWWQRIDRDATATLRAGVPARRWWWRPRRGWLPTPGGFRLRWRLRRGVGRGGGVRCPGVRVWRLGVWPGSPWWRLRRGGGTCWPRSRMPVWWSPSALTALKRP